MATDPAYRNMGLIRALFEMIHARSKSDGHLVQAITGIPHFFRQFGYEYALDLVGKRIVYSWRVPVYGATAGAGFPPLVFLQLLFCYRSLDELRNAFPDMWADEDTRIVLNALFPAQVSAPLPFSHED